MIYLMSVMSTCMHCVAGIFTQGGAEQASYIRQLVVIGLFVKRRCQLYAPTQQAPLLLTEWPTQWSRKSGVHRRRSLSPFNVVLASATYVRRNNSTVNGRRLLNATPYKERAVKN